MNNIFHKSFAFRIFSTFFSLIFLTCISANAQDTEERIINKIPQKLPIKVEIINGDSENLLSEVRIKVTNTGEKPIYFLKFFISTTEDFLSPNGNQYGFALSYGRKELITFGELANEDDIPLKKGEYHEFKVSDREVNNFSETLRQSFRSEPEKYLLEFQLLNFGDGTGFWGSRGKSFSTNIGRKTD